jgi:hypothetical protein
MHGSDGSGSWLGVLVKPFDAAQVSEILKYAQAKLVDSVVGDVI